MSKNKNLISVLIVLGLSFCFFSLMGERGDALLSFNGVTGNVWSNWTYINGTNTSSPLTSQYNPAKLYTFSINVSNTTADTSNVSTIVFSLGRPDGTVTNYTNSTINFTTSDGMWLNFVPNLKITGYTSLLNFTYGSGGEPGTNYTFNITFTQAQLGPPGRYNWTWIVNGTSNATTNNLANSSTDVWNNLVVANQSDMPLVWNWVYTGNTSPVLNNANVTGYYGLNLTAYFRTNFSAAEGWGGCVANVAVDKGILANSSQAINYTKWSAGATPRNYTIYVSGCTNYTSNTTGATFWVIITALADAVACTSYTGTLTGTDTNCAGGYCIHGYCRALNYYCGDSYCDYGTYEESTCDSDCETRSTLASTTPISTSETNKAAVEYGTIKAGDTAVFDFEAAEVSIDKIEMEITKVAFTVGLTAEKLEAKPADVAEPQTTGAIYQYIEITDKLNRLENKFENATITFKVPKTWIADNDLDAATVKLNRYVDGSWEALTTARGTDTSTEYVYTAETTGFSTFAIVAEKATAATAPEDTGEAEEGAGEEGGEEEAPEFDTTTIGIIIGILIIVAGGFLLISKKGRK